MQRVTPTIRMVEPNTANRVTRSDASDAISGKSYTRAGVWEMSGNPVIASLRVTSSGAERS